EAGDLGEGALRASDHLPGRDVVLRTVPWAHQATVPVDAAVGQVGEQVPASAAHREVGAARIADRVGTGPDHLPGGEVRGGSNHDLAAHAHLLASGRSSTWCTRFRRLWALRR